METSFISYLAAPLSRDVATLQRQLSSQRWWERERSLFELVVSEAVFAECRQGNPEAVKARAVVLGSATLLPLSNEILEIARQLISSGVFPKNATADAIHVAAATAYDCDYLLTWNFKHINNAQMKRAGTTTMRRFGYEPSTICTPDELMGSD